MPRALSIPPEKFVFSKADITRCRQIHTNRDISDGALSRAGLSDQSEGFTFLDAERHVVDGFDSDRLALLELACVTDDKVFF
jgi:hypothetical protein